MAKGNIPGYTAKRPIDAFPVGAKAWPEAMSRDRRAMAGFGGTVMSVSLRWQAERDNAEISRLQSSINDFQYTSLRQLEDDWRAGKFTNAGQFKQAEEDFAKARDRMVGKLVKGKRGIISDRVNEYAEQNKANDTAGFYRNLFSKEKEFMSVEGLKIVEGYKQQGERDKALMAIDQYKYWFGLSKSEMLKTNLNADMAVYQKQTFLDGLHEMVKTMPYKQAIQELNDVKGITSAERNDLIRRRERQEEIATATTNRKVRWDVLREVTRNPQNVTDEWLESLVKPDSLTWDDAEEFKKIRDDADEPLKTPRAQLYFNSLDALFDKRETDDEQRLNYDIANEKLVQFFETTKTPTAKQAAEFYDDLISEEARTLIDRILNPIGWPSGSVVSRIYKWSREGKKEELSEPATIVEFEDTVRLLDKEDAKAYYEKWKDKW